MNMSFIEKLITIFKYIGSSFASIELFILSLLLFALLIVNIKKKSRIINFLIIFICTFFLSSICICYTPYVKESIDVFIKTVMKYIYFPSTIAYFFIISFVIGMLIYSMFNKKLTQPKRIINYATFSLLLFLFFSFLTIAVTSNINLSSQAKLYSNETVLAVVQVSNLILLFWIVFTLFYQLYKFFKKKFDLKEKIES